jgi:transcriptional regulator with XRE-family HTH domain
MTNVNINPDATFGCYMAERQRQESAKAFGGQFRKYRKALGLRQSDCAKHFKVSLPTLIRWEAGENLPENRIDEICEFFGVNYWDMFPRPNEPIEIKPRPRPTLREAVEVVNEHAGEILIRIRPKGS